MIEECAIYGLKAQIKRAAEMTGKAGEKGNITSIV